MRGILMSRMARSAGCCARPRKASAPSEYVRTWNPSASSAIATEVRMFLSSSTSAIELATAVSASHANGMRGSSPSSVAPLRRAWGELWSYAHYTRQIHGIARSVCAASRPWHGRRGGVMLFLVTGKAKSAERLPMDRSRLIMAFLNLGHFLDHLAMLIYATAVLVMTREFGLSYEAMLPLSLGGFIAFGAGSLPSGWLGDRLGRRTMMAVFFFGLGAALVLAGFAGAPWQIVAALTLVGTFASIYHPVGIAMLVKDQPRVGRVLGWNGLWGNLGLAFSAVIAGWFADHVSWRAAATNAMPKIFAERLAALVDTTTGIGTLVAAVYVIAAMAQLVVGQLIDRYSLRRVFLALAALQTPLLLLAGALTDWAMLAIAMAMMFVMFGIIPIND